MRANIPINDFVSEDLLEDWTWLFGNAHTLIAMNNFADMFVRAADGSIGIVNVTWGTMDQIAPNTGMFEQMIRDRGNQDKWFLLDMLMQIERAGLTLGNGQCFGFKVPLRLGGKMDLSNVEVSSVSVYVSMMGQIHRQLKDVPPGTKITGVQIG